MNDYRILVVDDEDKFLALHSFSLNDYLAKIQIKNESHFPMGCIFLRTSLEISKNM